MFKRQIILFHLLLISGLLLAGCSRTLIARSEPPASEPVAQSGGVEAWMDALAAAGTTVTPKGEITQPFFTVPGQVVAVNGGEVQLYVYGDAAAAKSEAGLVSADGATIGTSAMMWMATPHFYHSADAIALYLGDDAGILFALEKTFGPQFAGG